MTTFETHPAAPELPPDLLVEASEPAHWGKAGTVAYPDKPVVAGMELGWENSPAAADRALNYTADLLSKDRDSELTVLSDRWSSSIVLEDVPRPGQDTKVYKVFRQASHYGYVEEEMATITFLHDLDLAPRPYLLIDAGEQYRSDGRGAREQCKDIPIARQDLGGELPIIVMDKIETEPVEGMSDEQLASEFMGVVRTGIEHRLSFADTEILYDTKKQRVTLLDLGGVGYLSDKHLRYVQDGDKLIDGYPGKTNEELLTARVATDVLHHFLHDRDVPLTEELTQMFIAEHGLEALCRPLVHHMRNAPRHVIPQFPNHWQPHAAR